MLFCFVLSWFNQALPFIICEKMCLLSAHHQRQGPISGIERWVLLLQFLMLDNDGVFSGSLSSGEETCLEHKVQYSGQVPSLACLQKASQFESCPVLCEVTEMLGINYGWGLPARGWPNSQTRRHCPRPCPSREQRPWGRHLRLSSISTQSPTPQGMGIREEGDQRAKTKAEGGGREKWRKG